MIITLNSDHDWQKIRDINAYFAIFLIRRRECSTYTGILLTLFEKATKKSISKLIHLIHLIHFIPLKKSSGEIPMAFKTSIKELIL